MALRELIPDSPKSLSARVILSGANRVAIAESNFFHRDPECRYAPFDPHSVRISTALRMKRWKKCEVKPSRISGAAFFSPPDPYKNNIDILEKILYNNMRYCLM